MGVAFYLQDPRFWTDEFHYAHYHLGMPNRAFDIVRDLLGLESPNGDNTGMIDADALLLKVAKARGELHLHGKEWERSEEPPPEGQEESLLKVLGTPGVDQDDLLFCLDTLQRIALYARENRTGVKWS